MTIGKGAIKTLWRALFDNPRLFEAVRRIMNHQIMSQVKQHIDLRGKTVLDVGCGTGTYSRIVDSKYLGVDLNPRFIGFAKGYYGSSRKQFAVQDVTKLKVKKKFDMAFYLSMLHHISDEDNVRLLAQLGKLAHHVIIVDLIRPKNNPIKAFIVDLDRGDFVRTVEEQKRIIGKSLDIKRATAFKVLTARHSLYICKGK